MNNSTSAPTEESLSLINYRIDAVQAELQAIRELAAAGVSHPKGAASFCIGIEAIAARSGRIMDSCRVLLGDPGAGSFGGDMDFMGDAVKRAEVTS
jgi:hypothetical protein